MFKDRKVNLDTLAQLGIDRKHAESLVLGLTPEGYVAGPDPDRMDRNLDVWVFGLGVSGQEVYVKLQVISEPPEACVCISFHVAEHKLRLSPTVARPTATEEER